MEIICHIDWWVMICTPSLRRELLSWNNILLNTCVLPNTCPWQSRNTDYLEETNFSSLFPHWSMLSSCFVHVIMCLYCCHSKTVSWNLMKSWCGSHVFHLVQQGCIPEYSEAAFSSLSPLSYILCCGSERSLCLCLRVSTFFFSQGAL